MKHRGRLRGVGTLRGCGVAARFASASVHLCGKPKITLTANRTNVGVSTFVGNAIIDSLQFCFSYQKKNKFLKKTTFSPLTTLTDWQKKINYWFLVFYFLFYRIFLSVLSMSLSGFSILSVHVSVMSVWFSLITHWFSALSVLSVLSMGKIGSKSEKYFFLR